jgi:hypothetical protein
MNKELPLTTSTTSKLNYYHLGAKTTSNEYEIPVGEFYKLNAKKKLGSGAFGDIYYGN